MPCLAIVVGKGLQPNTWYSSEPGVGDPNFKPAHMPTARSVLAAAALGPNLVGTFGGHASGGSASDVNEVYDHNANAWSARAPLPRRRVSAAAAKLDNGVAGIFGGIRDEGSFAITRVTEVYVY